MHFSRGRSYEGPGGDGVSQGLAQLCQLQSSLRKVGFDNFWLFINYYYYFFCIKVFYSPGFWRCQQRSASQPPYFSSLRPFSEICCLQYILVNIYICYCMNFIYKCINNLLSFDEMQRKKVPFSSFFIQFLLLQSVGESVGKSVLEF